MLTTTMSDKSREKMLNSLKDGPTVEFSLSRAGLGEELSLRHSVRREEQTGNFEVRSDVEAQGARGATEEFQSASFSSSGRFLQGTRGSLDAEGWKKSPMSASEADKLLKDIARQSNQLLGSRSPVAMGKD